MGTRAVFMVLLLMLAPMMKGFIIGDIDTKGKACSTATAMQNTLLRSIIRRLSGSGLSKSSSTPQITTTDYRDLSSRESTQPQRKCQSHSDKTLLSFLVLLATISCCHDPVVYSIKSVGRLLLSLARQLTGRRSSVKHHSRVISIRTPSSTSRLLITFFLLTTNILDGPHHSRHMSDMMGVDRLIFLHRPSVMEASSGATSDMDRNRNIAENTSPFLSEHAEIPDSAPCSERSPEMLSFANCTWSRVTSITMDSTFARSQNDQDDDSLREMHPSGPQQSSHSDTGKDCQHSSPSHLTQPIACDSEMTSLRKNTSPTTTLSDISSQLSIPDTETYVTAAPAPTPVPLPIPSTSSLSSSSSVSRSTSDSDTHLVGDLSANRTTRRVHYPTPSPFY